MCIVLYISWMLDLYKQNSFSYTFVYFFAVCSMFMFAKHLSYFTLWSVSIFCAFNTVSFAFLSYIHNTKKNLFVLLGKSMVFLILKQMNLKMNNFFSLNSKTIFRLNSEKVISLGFIMFFFLPIFRFLFRIIINCALTLTNVISSIFCILLFDYMYHIHKCWRKNTSQFITIIAFILTYPKK